MDKISKRIRTLQAIADTVAEKLRQRVEAEDPHTMNLQAAKHITGMLKDLRDIQLTRPEAATEGTLLTVCWEGVPESYSE